jgi:hypothetical protein
MAASRLSSRLGRAGKRVRGQNCPPHIWNGRFIEAKGGVQFDLAVELDLLVDPGLQPPALDFFAAERIAM